MMTRNLNDGMQFEDWYEELQEIATKGGESVSDVEAWREDFDAGKTPSESFGDEFN